MADKIYLCKYQIGVLAFMMGEENIIMDPSNVLALEYLNDYDFNLRAVIKMHLRVDIRKKLWILKNATKISVKFELDKIGVDTDENEYVTSPEVVWDGIFALYLNDTDDTTDVKELEERLSMNEGSDFRMNDINTENYYESHNFMTVFLFNQELLNMSANTFNCVFKKNTMQQFVGRILRSSKHKNVLISKFENDEIYKELLVPSYQAYKALIYLDQYYGFYKCGAMIYYDADTVYILNSNGRLTAKREGEIPYTTIVVRQLDASTPGNGMIQIEGNMVNYVSISEGNINPQGFSTMKNADIGSNIRNIVTDDITIDSTESNQTYIDQRNTNTIYSRKSDNKFAASIMKARSEENDIQLYISGENMDIGAFTPNKEFNVVFDETSKQEKYGPFRYRLSYAYHVLKLESDNYMTASHHIVIKKGADQDPVGGETIEESLIT